MPSGGTETKRLAGRVREAEAGRPLIELLQEWLAADGLADVPRARLRAAIVAGAVRVQGAVVRAPARALLRGERVDAIVRPRELVSPALRADRPFQMGRGAVLYRDRWLVAVDKPPGLPTHPTADRARSSLATEVAAFLGGAPLSVHQRLDRETSGVVLFATDPAANPGLARAFYERRVEKTYLALVECGTRACEERFTVREPLLAGAGPRVQVGAAGGRAAETRVWVVERFGDLALVEAQPITGRKHQIRAHLAHVGLPVLGDGLYGGRSRVGAVVAPRCLLHALRLVLPHPIEGRPLRIEAPLPDDLAAALAAARRG
jgi:23S rRNA pseudouridine1911/1915/1917 synthase